MTTPDEETVLEKMARAIALDVTRDGHWSDLSEDEKRHMWANLGTHDYWNAAARAALHALAEHYDIRPDVMLLVLEAQPRLVDAPVVQKMNDAIANSLADEAARWRSLVTEAHTYGSPDPATYLAALRARAESAEAMLWRIQHVNDGDTGLAHCPICCVSRPNHANTCELMKLLSSHQPKGEGE